MKSMEISNIMWQKISTYLFLFTFGAIALISYQTQSAQLEPQSTGLNSTLLDIPSEFSFLPSGSDNCSTAERIYTFPGGGQTIVNGMTNEPSDPYLACIAGSPVDYLGGRRTIWYQFTAEADGWITIEAIPNEDHRDNYDAALALHTGGCAALQTLSCSDDYNGFLPKINAFVEQGKTYQIEAVDWNLAVNGTAELNLIVDFTPLPNNWEIVGNMAIPRSRHSVVVVNTDIYVIGGWTSLTSTPTRTPAFYRFDTLTSSWSQLPNMPTFDGFGYANTDAVYLNNRIYLPSGDVGDPSLYDNTHWMFDLTTNLWSEEPTAPWSGGLAPAMIQTVRHPTQNGYFVLGGVTGKPLTTDAVPQNKLYFYNQDSKIWLIKADMPTARYAHTAALLGNQICVAGGIGASVSLIQTTECYNPFASPGLQWSTKGDLQIPRYNAGSAVAPNGKWYIFGGTDAFGNSIDTMEVYDPTTGNWTLMNPYYDLGIVNEIANRPPRAWPQGGFIGTTLWAVGGYQSETNRVIPLIEKIDIYEYDEHVYLPLIRESRAGTEPNDSFWNALRLQMGAPQYHDFNTPLNDSFDMFSFEQTTTAPIYVDLTNIPQGDNYDIFVYGANKKLWAQSINIGNLNEHISITNLPTGIYYILVTRNSEFFATNHTYMIQVHH